MSFRKLFDAASLKFIGLGLLLRKGEQWQARFDPAGEIYAWIRVREWKGSTAEHGK